jgi:uncharacterized protein (DUF2062 family)
MLFRRRTPETLTERVRVCLWPRVSWRRSARYFLKRTLRLSGSPYAVAMGCAAGAFASFTPFLGLHIVIAMTITWLLRGNLLAAALGTFVGNPLSFPFIWAGTYEVGHFIRHGGSSPAPDLLTHSSLVKSFDQLLPLVEPMLIGAIPLGLAAGAIMYFIVYRAVLVYRVARSARFAATRSMRSEAGTKQQGDAALRRADDAMPG